MFQLVMGIDLNILYLMDNRIQLVNRLESMCQSFSIFLLDNLFMQMLELILNKFLQDI